MYLDPAQKPISELFPIEGRSRYVIPSYQRGYSWNIDNIEELFDDILNEDEKYYIGNLLVTKESGEDNDEVYSVVDGQQRLTTIALFFLAIYENLEEKNNSTKYKENQRDIFSLETDIKRKLQLDNDSPRLKLLERDAEVFENYLGILDQKEKARYGTRAFAKRYKFITELVDENFEDFSELKGFYDKLNSLILLRITMGDLVDAFTVFSSLNAKGLPLTLIDLLKSTFIKATVDEIDTKKASELWDQLISMFVSGDSQAKSTAITQFLLNNYDTFISKKTSSITKTKALKKYQAVFDDQGYKYIYKLINRARLFSFISPAIDQDKDVDFGEKVMDVTEDLMKLDASQSYPLMLLLLDKLRNEKIQEQTVIDIFSLLVKFYVRRNIVLKPKASNIRAAFLSVVRKIEHSDQLDKEAQEAVRKTIETISVPDNEFKVALDDAVYEISPRTVRFILINLERKHGSFFNKQTKDTLDDYMVSKGKKQMPRWSLEHILPESSNLKNGWPEMISPDNVDEATTKQDKYMHKLGNLTLTGYNSEMSDRSFEFKRDFVVDGHYAGLKTGLFINESIPNKESEEKINTKASWTPEDIERRTIELSDLVISDFSLSNS
ncbi:type I restriction-modification system protein [Levilactobacillus koreensis JCM 16448]|uniref:DUF262 domain-containing protein n=1 Tax=Levilactobacillus koreensis TaxID=637971 RepID=A0AAC8ZGM6_9LACO|nr:hypothetical protein ABN16_08170 [Levilactobacillus koreensis]KRK86803.1 type I restriction-modification system protein [Levilactobacillus koreensis JCM 16448]